MLLQLKNNYIYLPSSEIVPFSQDAHFVIGSIDLNAADYSLVAVVNGEAIPFVHEFVIKQDKLKVAYLDITIEATHKDTGKTIKYKADRYPLTRAVILGKPSSEWYPSIIQSLKERIELLERHDVKSDEAIKAQANNIASIKDDIEIIELAIKEINETGEIV